MFQIAVLKYKQNKWAVHGHVNIYGEDGCLRLLYLLQIAL